MGRPSENGTPRPLPARLAGWVASVACARPRLMLWLGLLAACACVGYSVTHLAVHTSRSQLTDREARFSRSWQQYSDTFGSASDLMVVVQSPSPNVRLIRSVIDELGEKLKREPEHFENVLSRVDLTAMRRKALQFLTDEEIRKTATRLQTYDRVVREQNWDLIRSEKLAETLLAQIRRGQADGMVPEATWISAERFADSLSSYMQNALSSGRTEQNTFKPPLPELMTVASDQKLSDGALSWMINSEGTVGVLLVCLAQPQEPGAAAGKSNVRESSLARLRTLAGEAETAGRTDAAELQVSLTGIPALEHDELRSTSIDIRNAGLLAALLVGVVLFAVFRGMRHPMLALMTLLVSLCWTFGAATAVVGSVNIVSICFAIFLIGLSIDFSVSYIHRYLALRQELYELPDALREAAETTGSGILISAATAALAFSTALLTGFPGVAELGLIAAMGVILCAAAVFWFLPALIAISDADVDVEHLPQPMPAAKLVGWLTAWPVPAAAAAAVLVLLFSSQAFRWSDGRLQPRISYNPNLLELQDQRAESVVAERALDAAGTETVLHAVSIARSWEEAMQLRTRFLKLSSVGRVSDAASKLPEQPSGSTIQLLQSLQQQAASLPTSTPTLREGSYLETGRQADALYVVLKKSDHPRAKAAAASLDQFLNDLSKTPARESAAILTAWNTMTTRWLLGEYQEIAVADRFDPVDLRDLPRELKSRFLKIDADGRQQWALRIYPKENVWNGPELDRFVRELRTVDAGVTGAPIQVYESAGRMDVTWASVGLYALSVIFLILLFNYLRPGQKLLTVIPPIGVAAFIGYTLFQRNGTLEPSLAVMICVGLATFIAAVLDFRNLRDTVLTLMPALAGGAVLLGMLQLLGLQLNPMNLIALPLVFAIGVDNGIYLVADCRRQIAAGRDVYLPSADTLSSVIVTSLTSIAGFSGLLVSAHAGLFSVGLLLAIGVACCLVVSLLLMPPVLTLVARHQPASMEPVKVIREKSGVAEDTASRDAAAKNAQQKSKKAA